MYFFGFFLVRAFYSARYNDRYKQFEYYPSNPNRYEILGDNTRRCVYEGNWDKDLPLVKPIIQCEIKDLELNPGYINSIDFQNF